MDGITTLFELILKLEISTKHLSKNGIETIGSFPPVHIQPYYKEYSNLKNQFPNHLSLMGNN